MPFDWDSSDAFLMIRRGLWVWGVETAEVRGCSYHAISRDTASARHPCHRDTWLRFCLLPVSPVIKLSSPLHTVLFGRKSLCAAHT